MAGSTIRIGLGKDDALELPRFSTSDVWEFRPNRGQPLADVRQAAARAVTTPCDFPAISQAIVAGDRVVLAVDANVPEIGQVVAGAIDALPLGTIGELAVALSDEASEATAAEVRYYVADRGSVEIHQPADQEQHSYLAANAAADPIYLNRRLIDADFVLPVITARPTGSLDPHVLDGGVLPAFADEETQRRLRQETLEAGGADDREASEAAWLLGIQVVVAVIPSAEARVAQVLAGTPAGVRREAEHAIEASWRRDTSRKADLVFACLDGDDQQQSWENVARALHVGRHLVRPGGTIAVTSRVVQPIGKSLKRLSSTDPVEKVAKRLGKDRSRDALTASLILQLRQEGRVLLLSGLPGEQIEALGIGAIEDPEQLTRLIEGHASCAVIRAAQFCGIGAPQGE